jgi:hypothetical protein
VTGYSVVVAISWHAGSGQPVVWPAERLLRRDSTPAHEDCEGGRGTIPQSLRVQAELIVDGSWRIACGRRYARRGRRLTRFVRFREDPMAAQGRSATMGDQAVRGQGPSFV